MQTLQTDLNYISSLPDDPAMQTAQLKAEFDKAGNTIKTFLNEVHIPEIEDALGNVYSKTQVYTKTETYNKTEVDGFLTTINNSISSLTTAVNNRPTTAQVTNMINTAISGATTTYGTITPASGVTPVFNQLFKMNKLVHLFMEDRGTISGTSTGATVATIPSGFRPSTDVKCIALLTNNDFTMNVAGTIKSTGAVVIPRKWCRCNKIYIRSYIFIIGRRITWQTKQMA